MFSRLFSLVVSTSIIFGLTLGLEHLFPSFTQSLDSSIIFLGFGYAFLSLILFGGVFALVTYLTNAPNPIIHAYATKIYNKARADSDLHFWTIGAFTLGVLAPHVIFCGVLVAGVTYFFNERIHDEYLEDLKRLFS